MTSYHADIRTLVNLTNQQSKITKQIGQLKTRIMRAITKEILPNQIKVGDQLVKYAVSNTYQPLSQKHIKGQLIKYTPDNADKIMDLILKDRSKVVKCNLSVSRSTS